MSYAGFAPRLGAGIVDALVLLPVMGVYGGLACLSWEAAIAAALPYVFASAVYNVYCHARWGQTVGKRVLGIKVLTLVGEPICWRHALLRHSVDLAVAAAYSVVWVSGLLALSQVGFESAGFMERLGLVRAAGPPWGHWPQTIGKVWVLSELVVLLLNEKKRAIHDFLAGTVVVVLPAKHPSTPKADPEPSQCISCGQEIPAGMEKCPKCGWSYKE